MTARGLNIVVKAAVWVLRIVVGFVFAFSGWVKAVDPWGSLYKISDYLGAMGILGTPRPVILVLAVALATIEFAIGVMLAIGAYRRVTPWLLLLFMLAMTPLTVWIYVDNPVADCGCFGEAFVISNGATLAKNVCLLAASIFLVIFNRRVTYLYLPRLQWLTLVLTCGYALLLAFIGYRYQPTVNFGPHATGGYLFGEDSDLAVFDATDNDATATLDSLSRAPGGLLLWVVNDPQSQGLSRSYFANQLAKQMPKYKGRMAAIVATSYPQRWADDVRAQYPVYSADDTDLKSLVRGDAGYVYVNNRGQLQWRYSINAVSPEIADFTPPASQHSIEYYWVSEGLAVAYISLMTLIWLVGAFPLFFRRKPSFKKNE